MTKLKNKLENYGAALKRLREAITAYKNNSDNDLYRDALIQRYEFSFELAWKTTAEFLYEQGITDFATSPKAVFKAAYGGGFIDNEIVWLQMIEARNSMSHTYDADASKQIADDICYEYEKEMSALLKTMQSNL